MSKTTKADEALLERAVVRWGEVQSENKSDRVLVTESEWEQWEQFNKPKSSKLLEIVNSFRGLLSESQRSFLEELLAQISNAKRLTTDELWARKIDEDFDEARREVLRGSFDHA